MKKIISSVIIGFLIIGGLGAVAFDNSDHITKIKEIIHISQPIIKDSDEYFRIDIEESDSYICYPGKPLLPTVTRIFTFPLGTKIVDVDVRCEYEEYVLSKKIQPAPTPKIISKEVSQELNEVVTDETIYTSSDLYPSEPYILSRGAGLQDGNHVLFLNVKIALQYLPSLNLLFVPEEIEITVEYRLPEEPLFTADEYDMVIIAPSKFSSALQPLIDHKNNYGVRTFLKTTEEIYNVYEGRDQAEQIKYFIKDAIESFGISYVFLVGNIDIIPIRKAAVSWADYFDDIPTDLYYGDIYDANGSFCNWDSNEDNIFGEAVFNYADIIDDVDLYTDANIGRVPCKNNFELFLIVSKIITYEAQTYGKDWFNKIILLGGDTNPEMPGYEGEIVTEQVGNLMRDYGFITVKLWTSMNNFRPIIINREVTEGAGFVCYAGHGLERGIITFYPNSTDMIHYYAPYLFGLMNGDKLPIVFLNACLTASLDYNYHEINLACFAWSFVNKPLGGAIASIGATRVAYNGEVDDVITGVAVFNVCFFDAYKPGIMVSQMLTKAQNDYLNDVWDKDVLTIEEYILLGDPSLKIGGYT